MSTFLGRTILKILSNVDHRFKKFTKHQSIFKKSKAKENQLSPYIIIRATKNDYLPVIKMMHEAYCTEEPTIASLGIKQNSVLDELTLNDMAEGMSLVARCKYDGSLVGACINLSSHQWDSEMKEKLACSVQCPKVRHLLLFYAHLDRVSNLWNCYNVQKVFEISQVFVAKEHRKKGIAFKLMDESRTLAADCGFKVVRVDASSYYTAKLCEKLHMKQIAEIPYCSYLGKNLEPVFNPPHPHVSLKIYVDDSPQIPKPIK